MTVPSHKFTEAAFLLGLKRHGKGNAANVDAPTVAGGGGAPELCILFRQRALIRGRHPQPHQVPPPVQLLQIQCVVTACRS